MSKKFIEIILSPIEILNGSFDPKRANKKKNYHPKNTYKQNSKKPEITLLPQKNKVLNNV